MPILNPFTPEFLNWTLPFLKRDANSGFNQSINNRMANSVDPDETALRAVSSGSALFANVSVLVCRDERVNINKFI